VRSHLCRLLSIVVVCACAQMWAGTAGAHGVTLNVHHFLPADSALHTQFLMPWVEKLESESGGRLRLHLHPAMEMGGSPSQLYAQVKEGKADIVLTLAGYTPEQFPAVEVFELPFMVHSAEGASRALWEFVRLNDSARREFSGLRLLALSQHAAPQFHLAGKPIESVADLKGHKLRTPTPVASKLLQALGASPVELPITQVGPALASSAIDGALVSWDALPAFKLEEALRFHTETAPGTAYLYSAVFVLAMNPSSYKMLSDDLRKVINANSGIETSAALGKIFDASAAEARRRAVERGDAIQVLSSDDMAKLQASGQHVVDAWIKTLDEHGLSGKELVEGARASLREYDPPR